MTATIEAPALDPAALTRELADALHAASGVLFAPLDVTWVTVPGEKGSFTAVAEGYRVGFDPLALNGRGQWAVNLGGSPAARPDAAFDSAAEAVVWIVRRVAGDRLLAVADALPKAPR